LPSLQQKFANALSSTQSSLFYLLSPEAARLTACSIDDDFRINNKGKSGQRPAEKRGPGCFACGRKFFFGLIFWLLLYQDKSNWP
jgi:hypothetical protein